MVLFPLFFCIFSYDSPCTALTHRSLYSKRFCPWITSFFLSNIQHSISILHHFFLTISPIFTSLQFYPHYPHSYPHFNYYTVNNFHFINFIATFIPSFPIIYKEAARKAPNPQLPFKNLRMPKRERYFRRNSSTEVPLPFSADTTYRSAASLLYFSILCKRSRNNSH